MRPGLEPGQTRTDRESLADLMELGAGLSPDGIWALVALLEHVARRWMSEFMEPGEQSVGAIVRVEQILPRPAATLVVSDATLNQVRGRRYGFDVVLRNEAGELLGSGYNERVAIRTV
ncbi:MAG: thioesterase, FlK family [Dehalococcoidia bacterium]